MITPSAEAPVSVDAIVIGAGINGLAVARELSYFGLSVAVFDRSDIASETSAISTRVVHGGLKYLERAEIKLVLECVRERNILFRTAPHLIEHYPMLIPFLKSNTRPSWMLLAGLFLHELLSLVKPVPPSEFIGPKKMATRWPSLFATGVKYGAVYSDSRVPLSERFSAELVLDSVNHGAKFFTYTEVTKVLSGPNGVTGVAWKDVQSGLVGETSAPVIINAAGPWIDSVLALGSEQHPQLIGPSRGSHFMVRDFEGAPETCIFFESPLDSRPMFILPWEGMFMLGTTDIPVADANTPIVAQADEVLYTLNSVNTLLPQANLEPGDVLWSYSGVRPLPFTEGVDDPSKITRDYRLDTHSGAQSGLFTVVGGKWTTHRALGEDVARAVLIHRGQKPRKSLTRTAPLPGAVSSSATEDDNRPGWLLEQSHSRLLRFYGHMANEIIVHATNNPQFQECLDTETGAIAGEVWWAIEREGAKTLGDIVLRRMATFINDRAGLDSATRIAELLVSWGDWSRERADQELEDYRRWIERYTPWELARAW